MKAVSLRWPAVSLAFYVWSHFGNTTEFERAPASEGVLKYDTAKPFGKVTVSYKAVRSSDGIASFKSVTIATAIKEVTISEKSLSSLLGVLPWTLRVGQERIRQNEAASVAVEFVFQGRDLDGPAAIAELPIARIYLNANDTVSLMKVAPDGTSSLEKLDVNVSAKGSR